VGAVGPAARPPRGRGGGPVAHLPLGSAGALGGAAPRRLRPRGTVVDYGTVPEATIPAAFCLLNSITLKFFLVYELTADERAAVLAAIASALAENRLTHNVAQTFPLDEIVAAHEAVESGRVPGNVVLKIS
jgi:NADPH2:quinone reductase